MSNPHDPDIKEFMVYVRTLFMPLIVMKSFIMYFGLNYSQYPDEGYGYGLAASLSISVLSLSYFVYSQSKKNRT